MIHGEEKDITLKNLSTQATQGECDILPGPLSVGKLAMSVGKMVKLPLGVFRACIHMTLYAGSVSRYSLYKLLWL